MLKYMVRWSKKMFRDLLNCIVEKKVIKCKLKEIYICFINLQKAFDKIKRKNFWKNLKKRGIEEGVIEIIQVLYKQNIR